MKTTHFGVHESGEVSLLQIYLLRGLYLIWAVGLAVKVVPRFLSPDLTLPVMNTVVNSVLAGLSLSALVGVHHPLKMLPLMFFEIAWKALWLTAYGIPLWRAGPLDAETAEVFKAIATVVIFPLVLPWRYVFMHYIKSLGDRWK